MRDQSAFTIEIGANSDEVSICLVGSKRFGCGEIRRTDLEADEELISAAIDAFHDQAFSPRLELTQSDVSSLDGSTVRQDSRRALDALLGKEKRP